jgi:RNA polymerase sigma-70 factor (ECF subfamily)
MAYWLPIGEILQTDKPGSFGSDRELIFVSFVMERNLSLYLLKRIAEKDLNAFSIFYDSYAAVIYSLALRIVRNSQEAEDIVQQVFLQVWHKASQYDAQQGSPQAWLMTIARNQAIDKFRLMRSKREVNWEEMEKPVSENPQSSGEPLYSLLDKEKRDLILDALRTLSPSQRSAIELAYFEGLSHREISEKLKEPLGTIKTRINLGLKKLRDMLQPHFRE